MTMSVRYHFVPTGMAKKKKKVNKRVLVNVEKLEPLEIAAGNVKWCGHCEKQFDGS